MFPKELEQNGLSPYILLHTYVDIHADYMLTWCTINCQMTVIDHANSGKVKITWLFRGDWNDETSHKLMEI